MSSVIQENISTPSPLISRYQRPFPCCYLTTESQAEVGTVDQKAMQVILTKPEEFEQWLTSPTTEAL
jgi:putative SOS response-associated peptidase YedK